MRLRGSSSRWTPSRVVSGPVVGRLTAEITNATALGGQFSRGSCRHTDRRRSYYLRGMGHSRTRCRNIRTTERYCRSYTWHRCDRFAALARNRPNTGRHRRRYMRMVRRSAYRTSTTVRTMARYLWRRPHRHHRTRPRSPRYSLDHPGYMSTCIRVDRLDVHQSHQPLHTLAIHVVAFAPQTLRHSA